MQIVTAFGRLAQKRRPTISRLPDEAGPDGVAMDGPKIAVSNHLAVLASRNLIRTRRGRSSMFDAVSRESTRPLLSFPMENCRQAHLPVAARRSNLSARRIVEIERRNST